MIIVGDKITKINAIRGELKRGTSIESKPEIKNIYKKDLFSAGEKRDGLTIEYTYSNKYGKTSKIEIEGSLFVVGESKKLKDLEKSWKKNKKMEDGVAVPVLRKIFEVGMTNSVIIAKTLDLPAPIHFPKVVPKE